MLNIVTRLAILILALTISHVDAATICTNGAPGAFAGRDGSDDAHKKCAAEFTILEHSTIAVTCWSGEGLYRYSSLDLTQCYGVDYTDDGGDFAIKLKWQDGSVYILSGSTIGHLQLSSSSQWQFLQDRLFEA